MRNTVMAKSNGLSRGKDHQMNGQDNLDKYCTKKKKQKAVSKISIVGANR